VRISTTVALTVALLALLVVAVRLRARGTSSTQALLWTVVAIVAVVALLVAYLR